MGSALESARQGMHALFPLPESMWLAWATDQEQSGADAAALVKLCAEAVEDYLSVPLWERYLRCLAAKLIVHHQQRDFSMHQEKPAHRHAASQAAAGQLDGPQLRAVEEQAIAAAGLHIPGGSGVWASCR